MNPKVTKSQRMTIENPSLLARIANVFPLDKNWQGEKHGSFIIAKSMSIPILSTMIMCVQQKLGLSLTLLRFGFVSHWF